VGRSASLNGDINIDATLCVPDLIDGCGGTDTLCASTSQHESVT
jgi:hypothetical protein